MSLELPFGIAPVNAVPVDAYSGPYTGTSISDAIDNANAGIPAGIRFQSMEVRLIVDDTPYKYWYYTGIADADLVSFSSSISGGGMTSWDLSVTGNSISITDGDTVEFSGQDSITITRDGTTVIISGAASTGTGETYTAGTGLQLNGNEFSIDDTVVQTGDNISLLNNDVGYATGNIYLSDGEINEEREITINSGNPFRILMYNTDSGTYGVRSQIQMYPSYVMIDSRAGDGEGNLSNGGMYLRINRAGSSLFFNGNGEAVEYENDPADNYTDLSLIHKNYVDVADSGVSGIASYASGIAASGYIRIAGNDVSSSLLNPSGIYNEYAIVWNDANSEYTLSGLSDIYSAGSGLVLVGTEFNTSGTGNFDVINFTPVLDGDEPSHKEGTIFYSDEHKTLSIYNDIDGLSLEVGQEEFLRGRNNTGGDISIGEAVLIDGSQGTNATIRKAIASDFLSSQAIGLAAHNISNNSFGYITTYGLIEGIDTSSFAEGDPVWLSPTTSGALVNSSPVAPYYQVLLGHVINSAASNGSILVTPHTAKLGGGDVKTLGNVAKSGIPFIDLTSASEVTSAVIATSSNFIYDSGNSILEINTGGIRYPDGEIQSIAYTGISAYSGINLDGTINGGEFSLGGTGGLDELTINNSLKIPSFTASGIVYTTGVDGNIINSNRILIDDSDNLVITTNGLIDGLSSSKMLDMFCTSNSINPTIRINQIAQTDNSSGPQISTVMARGENNSLLPVIAGNELFEINVAGYGGAQYRNCGRLRWVSEVVQNNGSEIGTSFTISTRDVNNGLTDRIIIDEEGYISFNEAYTFPQVDGTANQIFQTDGSGNISFVDFSSDAYATTGELNSVSLVADYASGVADSGRYTIVGYSGSSVLLSPSASEDGYAIVWDNANQEFTLDQNFSNTLGGQDLSSLVTNPDTSEDGWAVVWNDDDIEYTLAQIPTYSANSGILLVGSEFITSGTGSFDGITFSDGSTQVIAYTGQQQDLSGYATTGDLIYVSGVAVDALSIANYASGLAEFNSTGIITLYDSDIEITGENRSITMTNDYNFVINNYDSNYDGSETSWDNSFFWDSAPTLFQFGLQGQSIPGISSFLSVLRFSSISNTTGTATMYGCPINYSSDYSSQYTNRSMVDKGYVDSIVPDTGDFATSSDLSTVSGIAQGAADDVISVSGLLDGYMPNTGILLGDDSINIISSQSDSVFASLILDPNNENEAAFSYLNDIGEGYFLKLVGTEVIMGYTLDGSNLDAGISIQEEEGIFYSVGSSPAGLKYGSDYSANFTDRSLVDKAYVDSIVPDTGQFATTGDVSSISGYLQSQIDSNVSDIVSVSGIATDAYTAAIYASGVAENTITGADNSLTVSNGLVSMGGTQTADIDIIPSTNNSYDINFGSTDGNRPAGLQVYSTNNAGLNVGDSSNNAYFSAFDFGSFSQSEIGFLADGTDITSLSFYTNSIGIVLRDDSLNRGIVYNSDYSANYTDRSLVDKEYVDNAISSGGGTSYTATSGIAIDSNDVISMSGDGYLNKIGLSNGLDNPPLSTDYLISMQNENSNAYLYGVVYSNTNTHSVIDRVDRARGTISSPSTVQDTDRLYRLNIRPYGSSFQQSAYIDVEVDGTPVGNTVPTKFIIATENSSSLSERFVIDGSGDITFNGAYTFPSSDGSSGEVLQTDGSGQLSFGAVSADLKPYTVTDAGGTAIPTDASTVQVTLGTETISNTAYSLASNEITFLEAGVYQVSVTINIDEDSTTGGQRARVDLESQLDSVALVQGYAAVYTREASGGSGFSTTFNVQVTANQVLDFFVSFDNNTNTTDASTGLTQVSIIKIG